MDDIYEETLAPGDWCDDCETYVASDGECECNQEAEWCNCQAIPGTPNYPGPWHERGGEPHYPCSKGR